MLFCQLEALLSTAWTFSRCATVISRFLRCRRRSRPLQPTSGNRRPRNTATVEVPPGRLRIRSSKNARLYRGGNWQDSWRSIHSNVLSTTFIKS